MTEPTMSEVHALLVLIDRRTANIEEALFTGNGAPPVLSRLSTLEERTGKVEAKTHSAPVWTGLGGVLGAALAALLGYFGIGPRQP